MKKKVVRNPKCTVCKKHNEISGAHRAMGFAHPKYGYGIISMKFFTKPVCNMCADEMLFRALGHD